MTRRLAAWVAIEGWPRPQLLVRRRHIHHVWFGIAIAYWWPVPGLLYAASDWRDWRTWWTDLFVAVPSKEEDAGANP